MYRLAYVEYPRPARACGAFVAESPHFRIETFATLRAALDHACEIIGAPTISSVEVHSDTGEIVFDTEGLARELGWPLPPDEPLPPSGPPLWSSGPAC